MFSGSGQTEVDSQSGPSPLAGAAQKLVKLSLGLCGVVLLLWIFLRGEAWLHPHAPSATSEFDAATQVFTSAVCGESSQKGQLTVFDMVTSPDVGPWIEQAASAFSKQCPNLHLRLIEQEDLEAARDILTGEQRPALWAPADELVLRYVEHERRAATPPLASQVPIDLIASPLVVLIWEDRLKLLSFLLREQASEEGQWLRGLCAGVPRDASLVGVPRQSMTPGRWADLYAPLVAPPPPPAKRRQVHATVHLAGDGTLPLLSHVESWGMVKIGHPRPTRFTGGLAALYLLSRDFVLGPRAQVTSQPTSGPASADFETALSTSQPALSAWLRRCEAGLELPPLSESALTEALFTKGPSYLDAVVTYEHLALPLLQRIDANPRSLKTMAVLYPSPTLVARHPAVIFAVEPEKQEAARRFLAFLRSPEMQERAIPLGFRPVTPDVSVRNFDPIRNRFLSLRRYGVLPAPHLIEAPRPSGRALVALIETWSEAIGSR